MSSPYPSTNEHRPRARGAFVGREPFIRDLLALQSRRDLRVLTLTGPAGVGKTRLRIELLAMLERHGKERGIFVPLANVRDAKGMLPAIARELGISSSENVAAAIASACARPIPVVVLDNMEQIVDARLSVAALADSCPSTTFVVTSRTSLELAREVVRYVEPLELVRTDLNGAKSEMAPASRLFVERACEVDRDFTLKPDERAIIADICEQLDGLPLAIELAAAWARALSPREILGHLDRGLDAFRPADRLGDSHQQTLRAAIRRSYDLLGDDDQRLFRRLAIFTGGFDLSFARRLAAGRAAGSKYRYAEGYGRSFQFFSDLGFDPTESPQPRYGPADAPALARIPSDVVDGIATLVNSSLVRRRVLGDGSSHYEMLATIREFGLEELEAAGELDATRHAHAEIMLAFSEVAGDGIWYSPQRIVSDERISAQMPDVAAAIEWGETHGRNGAEIALRIVEVMWFFWQTRGYVEQGRHWVETTLANPLGEPIWRVLPLTSAGYLAWIQGDDARARHLLEEAIPIAESIPFHDAIARAHFYLALIEWRRGDERFEEMVRHIDRAETEFERAGDRIGQAVCMMAQAIGLRTKGLSPSALELLGSALGLSTEVGYEWGIATGEFYTAASLIDLERYLEAFAPLQRSTALYERLGDRWGTGVALGAYAVIASALGDPRSAAVLFGAADSALGSVQAMLPPTEQEKYETVERNVRRSLGVRAFRSAYAEGQRLDHSEAVALASQLESGLQEPAEEQPEPVSFTLTPRELEVLMLIAEGKRDGEIASALFVAKKTVSWHVGNMLGKAHASNRTELVTVARRSGLI